jgi:hypothetical protein
MNPLRKAWLSIIGWSYCIYFVLKELIKERMPDLNFMNPPTHPNDYFWYSERVNGRAAMLAVVFILFWELLTKQSVWKLIGVL